MRKDLVLSFCRPRDFYHTCYGLSGLSIAQHVNGAVSGRTSVVGNPNNELVIFSFITTLKTKAKGLNFCRLFAIAGVDSSDLQFGSNCCDERAEVF